MSRRTAGLLMLAASVVLATLLLTKTISTVWGTVLFAIALLFLGGLSRGFKKES